MPFATAPYPVATARAGVLCYRTRVKRQEIVLGILIPILLAAGMAKNISKNLPKPQPLPVQKPPTTQAPTPQATVDRTPTVNCVPGYDYIPFASHFYIMVLPENCWTSWLMRPTDARRAFLVDFQNGLDVELYFADGTTKAFIDWNPMREWHPSFSQPKITGVRFRNKTKTAIRAVIHQE
jgi:hypothetical protein